MLRRPMVAGSSIVKSEPNTEQANRSMSSAQPPRPRPRRVFLGFTDVAGLYHQLAEGFEELGVEPWVVALRPHPFRYEHADPPNRLLRLVVRLGRPERGPARTARRAARDVLVGVAFLRALATCDGFVIGFPSSSLHRPVLAILRVLRRNTVVVFHGSDHRPPYLDGGWTNDLSGKGLAKEARRRQRMVRAAERTGVVVANPLSAQFHTRPFVAFQVAGIPCGPHVLAAARAAGPMRLVHAPSDQGIKGTDRIREIVDDLRARGADFSYRELSDVPNAVVRQALREADLLIDQCYSDTTMAGLAAEAAEVGTGAVAASLDVAELRRVVPASGWPPTVLVASHELRDTIAGLVRDAAAVATLGQAAQSFVSSTWERRAVAERYLTMLGRSTPSAWMVDPGTVQYVLGCGLTAAQVSQRVSAVCRARGPHGLALDHNQGLAERMVAGASGVTS